MDPQILAAVITVGLTVAAGIAGFLFREYRNRIRPFIAITKVEGDFREGSTRVEIPISLLNALNEAVYMNKLSANERLNEVFQTWTEARELIRRGPEFLSLLDSAISAADAIQPQDVQKALERMLNNEAFDRWICYLFSMNVVAAPDVNKDLPIAIHMYPSDQRDGCVILDFPKSPVWFGTGFDKYQIKKQKCQPFLDLVVRLDLIGLTKVFHPIKRAMEKEIGIAKDIEPVVRKLLEENSTWEIEIYLASLGPNPFLVDTDAMLRVRDETGARYDENCGLTLIDGDGKIHGTTSPLVVGREKDVKFAYFTTNVQGKMKRGQAFREAFSSNSAKCWVEFGVQKTGIVRRSRLSTPKVPFREPS